MRIQVRQQVLETWRAALRYTFRDGTWQWGGRRGRNCVSDAEQLLTLLFPAAEVGSLRVDLPDQTAEDVLEALSPLGDALDIPRSIVRILTEYFREYRDADGLPVFPGGSYLVPADGGGEVNEEQRRLEVVDSYSMAITLCLSTLSLVRVFRTAVRSGRVLDEVRTVEALASERLTAAMAGLLRSFSVQAFDLDSPQGQALCRMINQSGIPDRRAAELLLDDLREIRAALAQEVTIGSGRVAEELENPSRLFECGWSWGVVDGAPPVDNLKGTGSLPGYAEDRPYLYFTVIALDGIQDLFAERTRVFGLLDEDQQRLARALQLRWEITQGYWARVATAGHGKWPLEDLPWRTTDGVESDYSSLFICSMTVQDAARREMPDRATTRITRVLEDLASRGRITRRSIEADPAIELHVPGRMMRLIGSEKAGGAQLGWLVSTYSAMLLKRVLQMAAVMDRTATRQHLLALADQVWDHLAIRRIKHGAARDLWDQPRDAFPLGEAPEEAPSWFHTERVLECLVAAAQLIERPPLVSASVLQAAEGVLAEAEHLFDQELLNGTIDVGRSIRERFRLISAKLNRARQLLAERPGTAMTLASDVLRELDQLAAARQDLTGMS